MQLSMKCSVAVHCLLFIWEARGKARVTSTLLAQSTGCNPVVIRNILSALKKAGLITVPRGQGGAELCRDPEQITLYQIYAALEPQGLTSLIGILPKVATSSVNALAAIVISVPLSIALYRALRRTGFSSLMAGSRPGPQN